MPTLQRLLNLVISEDHRRGCEGRTYTCSCGYEAGVIDAAEAVDRHKVVHLLREAHEALSEVFADHDKVNSLAWTDKAGGVITRLKREIGGR